MENASKALLFAGEILVALLVLSLMVYFVNKIINIPETYNEKLSEQQIQKLNAEIIKYIKHNGNENYDYVTPQDVVSICKIKKEYEDKGITIEITGLTGLAGYTPDNIDESIFLSNFLPSYDSSNNTKTDQVFQISITYNKGVVNKIDLTKKNMNTTL